MFVSREMLGSATAVAATAASSPGTKICNTRSFSLAFPTGALTYGAPRDGCTHSRMVIVCKCTMIFISTPPYIKCVKFLQSHRGGRAASTVLKYLQFANINVWLIPRGNQAIRFATSLSGVISSYSRNCVIIHIRRKCKCHG